MATTVFLLIIALSLAVALFSRRGHSVADMKSFFIASREFGGALLFFLAVGEIYSIGTLIGFPGGIYAHGSTYAVWFLGYILLAYPVGYFINPWIWRAGQRYDAVTLPDLFRGHFGSRPLELVVTLAAILFMIPWGQLQFTGLVVALQALGWQLPPLALLLISAAMAFAYMLISGVRAPAYVSIIKDTLLVVAVVATGLAAVRASGLAPIFDAARAHVPDRMTGTEQSFAMSTILFQALGFYMFPFSFQYVFTAGSARIVRRTQVLMPLYMLMFPFLVIASYYALAHGFALRSANQAFMAAAVSLLPGWLLGLVAAAAALSAFVVLTGLSLSIGPLVSRNLLTGLGEGEQKRGAQGVVALYLLLSVVATLYTPNLMVTLINTAYFGITQFFPGVMAILFFRRVSPMAVLAGIVLGDVLSVGMYLASVPVGGLNIGLIGLAANVLTVVVGSRFARGVFVPVAAPRAVVASAD